MPEGDAVRRTAARLDAALAGKRLTLAQIRVPRFATVDLAGADVVATEAVGKHLLTRMERGRELVTLHSHLRMDGRWVTGAPGSRPCSGPAHQIRVWLMCIDAQAVGLRLAQVAVVPRRDEHRLIGHLGPDLLAAQFDPGAAATRLTGDPGRGLVELLLDQTIVSGLGTMWAAELAHAIGVNPYARATEAQLLAVGLLDIRARMLAAVTEGPRRPRAGLRVFERAGRPCAACGTPIRHGRVGAAPQERVTYWCPRCQPG